MKPLFLAMLICSLGAIAQEEDNENFNKTKWAAGYAAASVASYKLTRSAGAKGSVTYDEIRSENKGPHSLFYAKKGKTLTDEEISKIVSKVSKKDRVLVRFKTKDPEVLRKDLLRQAKIYRGHEKKYNPSSTNPSNTSGYYAQLAEDLEKKAEALKPGTPIPAYVFEKEFKGNLLAKIRENQKSGRIFTVQRMPSTGNYILYKTVNAAGVLGSVAAGYGTIKNISNIKISDADRNYISEKFKTIPTARPAVSSTSKQ